MGSLMPEGPMDPEVTVETANAAAENIAAQPAGLADLLPDAQDVPPGQAVHFPQHAPRLYAGGKATLKALRGH